MLSIHPDLFLICRSHLNSPSWVLHSALLSVKFQPLHYGPPLQLAKTIPDPSPVPSKAAATTSKARTPASFTSWLPSPALRSMIKLLSAHGKAGIPARCCQEGPLVWNTASTGETQHRVQTGIAFKGEMKKMRWLQQCFCKWRQKKTVAGEGGWMQRGGRRCRACGPTVNHDGLGTPLSCLLVEFCPSQQQQITPLHSLPFLVIHAHLSELEYWLLWKHLFLEIQASL